MSPFLLDIYRNSVDEVNSALKQWPQACKNRQPENSEDGKEVGRISDVGSFGCVGQAMGPTGKGRRQSVSEVSLWPVLENGCEPSKEGPWTSCPGTGQHRNSSKGLVWMMGGEGLGFHPGS